MLKSFYYQLFLVLIDQIIILMIEIERESNISLYLSAIRERVTSHSISLPYYKYTTALKGREMNSWKCSGSRGKSLVVVIWMGEEVKVGGSVLLSKWINLMVTTNTYNKHQKSLESIEIIVSIATMHSLIHVFSSTFLNVFYEVFI